VYLNIFIFVSSFSAPSTDTLIVNILLHKYNYLYLQGTGSFRPAVVASQTFRHGVIYSLLELTFTNNVILFSDEIPEKQSKEIFSKYCVIVWEYNDAEEIKLLPYEKC